MLEKRLSPVVLCGFALIIQVSLQDHAELGMGRDPAEHFMVEPSDGRHHSPHSMAAMLNVTLRDVQQYTQRAFTVFAKREHLAGGVPHFPLKTSSALSAMLKNVLPCRFDAIGLKIFTSHLEKAGAQEDLSNTLLKSALSEYASFSLKEQKIDSVGDCIRWTLVSTKEHPISQVALSRVLMAIWNNPHVRWIERVLPMRPLNNIATKTLQTTIPAVKHPVWAKNITGTGQIIAIGDTGLNHESCFFRDATAAVPFYPQLSFRHRKVVTYVPCLANGKARMHLKAAGHGTHVCCSAVGKSETHEAAIFNGIAYDAKIYFHALSCGGGDDALNLPYDLVDYFTPQRNANAWISSNSWGSEYSPTRYTHNDKQTDKFLYENPGFLAIFAAGNDPSGGILSPATSKNALTVSAHYNSIITDHRAKVSKHAAHGPTYDGRTKPDILGPGEFVTSAASCENHFGAVCDLGVKAGTSMAAPLIAGSAALIRQYFTQGFYPSGRPRKADQFQPTGALLKAMVIHGAHHPGKQKGENTRPNVREGWGRLEDMRYLLHFYDPKESNHLYVTSSRHLGHREQFDKCFSADASSQTSLPPYLRATLVWMDPPLCAVGAPQSMVHDLDLIVSFSTGEMLYSNEQSAFDTKNNVEQITYPLPPQQKGFQFKVSVFASLVRGQHDTNSTQPFALVVSAPSLRAIEPRDSFQCPNNCTNHGVCGANGNCHCRHPFYHVDCSLSS